MWSDSNLIKKKRVRDTDVISFEKVYKLQEKTGLKQKDMCELFGISKTQWQRYEKRGVIKSFRFFAAVRAIQLEATKRANQIIDETNKLLDLDE